MISLVDKIPKLNSHCAESIKINCNYQLYKDVALFWVQDGNKAVISMLDGNMVILNVSADIDELREFVNMVSPLSVFSDADTMTSLFGERFHRVFVMQSDYRFKGDKPSDTLNSSEIYRLLDVKGLSLPPYEFFAVDFCYRLNHGCLKYFALKEICAAIGISDGQAVLLNGIASHKKGMGSVALHGVLSQFGYKTAFAVCERDVCGFYEKNNFRHIYDGGYWRKDS